MEEQKESPQDVMKQINRALGLFVSFFGAVVLFSILYTETFAGRMTNLGAGLILIAIGAGMVLRSRVKSKATSPEEG